MTLTWRDPVFGGFNHVFQFVFLQFFVGESLRDVAVLSMWALCKASLPNDS